MAIWVCSHHISGDCSAQPGCRAIMGDSSSGYCADASAFCDAASTTETFIEDVPISIPSNNMIFDLTRRADVYNSFYSDEFKLFFQYAIDCRKIFYHLYK